MDKSLFSPVNLVLYAIALGFVALMFTSKSSFTGGAQLFEKAHNMRVGSEATTDEEQDSLQPQAPGFSEREIRKWRGHRYATY
jgi:hypothetical protein